LKRRFHSRNVVGPQHSTKISNSLFTSTQVYNNHR